MNMPEIRNDSRGHGYYGAPRRKKLHRGIDFVCDPQQDIIAFRGGVVTKLGYAYADDLSWRYIEITDDNGYQWRYFYVTLIHAVGETVLPDDIIGFSQDISLRYKDPDKEDMMPHYHLEIMKDGEYFDPSPFIAQS